MLPPSVLVAIFVIFFMPWLNFCRHFSDLCPADHVSYWQPRVISLGLAGATMMRSLATCRIGKRVQLLLLLLLFLTFNVLVANPKNFFTRWPIPFVVC